MEQNRSKNRTPQGALAAEKRHCHHENTECRRRKCYLNRLDVANHISKHCANATHVESRNTPTKLFVFHGWDTHCFSFIFIITNSICSQTKLSRKHPADSEVRQDRKRKTDNVKED